MGDIVRKAASLRALLCSILVAIPVSGHPGSAIAVDPKGRVFFVDTGGGVFRIDAPGRLTRLGGPAFHWMALDLAGYFANRTLPSGPGWELVAAGSEPTLVLSSDFPVVVAGGALFTPRPAADGRIRIHRFEPDGRESVLATLQFRAERDRWLGGLAAGPEGSLYFTEGNSVRRLARDGKVTTLAEEVQVAGCLKPPGYVPDSGRDLRGLAVAPDGTVYVAASGCSALLRVTPRGETTVVLRSEPPWAPTAVALHGEDVYVLEYTHSPGDDRRAWLPRVRKVARGGEVSVLVRVEKR